MTSNYAENIKNIEQILQSHNDLTPIVQNNYYMNLGYYHNQLRNYITAIQWFKKIKPMDYSTYMSIAAIYTSFDLPQSFPYTEKCLELRFTTNVAYDLACNYTKAFRFDKAYGLYETILLFDRKYINAYNNRSEILNCMFRQTEALDGYTAAYDLDNTRLDILSNIIMSTYYIPKYIHSDREKYLSMFDKHMQIDKIDQLKHSKRIDGKKIRIGYIGYDFNKQSHPITCFVKHILDNHSSAFTIFCYQVSTTQSNVFQGNNGSSLYTQKMEHITTRNLSNITDKEASMVIRNDDVDILVELMNHTAGNRLKILAYKPAPIQISYCAFPGTTGMAAIDYKILDKTTNTQSTDKSNTEKILCMPNGFHCFVPTYEFPPIIHSNRNTINLCCFNNVKKINRNVISVWVHILRLVPTAQLYLRYSQYSSSYVREHVLHQFRMISEEYGYDLKIQRIHFIGCKTDYKDVLELFSFMDIFLDTFPYTGTTVICEALTMNVPVITLMGKHVHERVGASLLHSIGLDECVASDSSEYVNAVVELCKNPLRLKELKNSIPLRMKNSILGNPSIFIKEYETIMYSAIEEYNNNISLV